MSTADRSSKAKVTKLQFNDIASFRRKVGENQQEFWRRFGVTQSGGSRYETGRSLPKPVRLLLSLWTAGTISDEDLAAAAGRKLQARKAAA